MKAGFDGGSQTHQHIQIPLLMPSRYERHTADIWEQIYGKGERADRRPDVRVYETWFCWHKRPYWQITINRQNVINVSDWKATFRVYISHLMGFQHKKESIYLFWGPSPTRYSITLSRVPLSLGSTGLARGGPGGCIPTTTKSLSGKNILRPWTQHWSCPQVQAGENMLFFIDFFFFLTASHWIWLAKHVQDPCCVGK